ncbi:MAG TPA: outer membrane beta-barrel protein [Verrucomicrobiae bacterium]|nr:outer membrane beta-barrel protein [Verrucomicrobiae bacterium]
MRTMFKIWLLLVTLGLASQVRAQGPVIAGVAPVFEGGIGYSYVKSTVPSQGNLAMKGVVASASGDLNSHFGAKLEVGYSRSFDAFQTGRAADILTYMGGPVFYPIRRRKFDFHAQVLAGGARETGVNFENDGTLIRGYVNHFAWEGGAGFQFRMSEALSLRPEIEYLRTSYFNSNVAIQGQTNLRTTLNLIYTFGRRRE